MRLVILVLAAALCITTASYAAGPVVLLKHNEQYHGFMKLPRLSEVVTAVNKEPTLYWPAARLYKTDPEAVVVLEKQRQDLLDTLGRLQQTYLQDGETELAASAEHLLQEIKNWVLAKQLFLALDPDVVRAKVALNPKLRAGQYLLQVAKRPDVVTVTGLAQNTELSLLNAADAADYVEKMNLLAGASSSFLYILPSSQPVILAKTGLWNSQRQDVPVGAVLYVPFEQRVLPSDFEDINQKIIELLQHRVVL